MAFCGKCGNQLEEGAKFCPKCGTEINGSQEQQEINGKKFSTLWVTAFAILTILVGSYFITDIVSPETHNTLFGWVSFGDSPASVANKVMDCFKEKDFEKLYTYVYTKDNLTPSEEKEAKKAFSSLMSKFGMALNIKGGIKDYSIISKNIGEESATIQYKIIFGDGTFDEDFNLKMRKNKKGEWKLNIADSFN